MCASGESGKANCVRTAFKTTGGAKLVLSTGIFTELLSFGYPEAVKAGAMAEVMS